jgi:hypothetical protein
MDHRLIFNIFVLFADVSLDANPSRVLSHHLSDLALNCPTIVDRSVPGGIEIEGVATLR